MANKHQQRAARAEQMRKEREKAGRRQRNVISIAVVAVVVALIAVAAWAVSSADDEPTQVLAPKNATKDYGIVYDGGATAAAKPVSVEVYGDFQCPVCRQFEQQSKVLLEGLVTSGEITITYRPFSFLDGQGSPNEYSHRSTNLALCALDQGGVTDYRTLHDYLYENQPREGTNGPEDPELLAAAEGRGITGLDSCVNDERFFPWIDDAMGAGEKRGVGGTPTVFVDGKPVANPLDAAQLQQAIDDAKNG